MKKILMICCLLQSLAYAQGPVFIAGDTSLCQGQSSVLSVSDQFVSYQWMIKPITIPNLPVPVYTPISGATSDTLVINHFDHSAHFICVRLVTSNGDTLYSEEREILGYAFSNPYMLGVYHDWQSSDPDTGEVFICPGDTVGLQFMPEYFYNDITWEKDGQVVSTDTTYLFTQAGMYRAGGKSALCPNNFFWTNFLKVSWCVLSVDEHSKETIRCINPVTGDVLTLTDPDYAGTFEIFNEWGDKVLAGQFQQGSIRVSPLSNGIYFLVLSDGTTMKFVR